MALSVVLRRLSAVLTFATAAASAQTIVDLHHNAGTCSFTSDAAGLVYDAASGHVSASNLAGSPFSGNCGGGAPTTPAFTQALGATPSTPALNQAFTLAWNTSNADYCRTDGSSFPVGASLANWPLAAQICSGAACAPGSKSITTTVAGSYFFNLQCFKNGVATPAVSSLTLNISGAGNISTCDTSPPVLGSGKQQLSATVWYSTSIHTSYPDQNGSHPFTYDEVFNEAPGTTVEAFPQVGNRAVSFALESGKYVALRFKTPSNLGASVGGNWGAFSTNYIFQGPPFPSSNGVSYAVSQCPGSFDVASACKGQWNGTEGSYIAFAAPEASDPYHLLCKLERGKDYYLNIITAPLASPQVSACGGSSCAVSISYTRLQ